ncbi:MAG: hypothetical protein ACYTG0_16745, partial [Planctomycetota bacterium]
MTAFRLVVLPAMIALGVRFSPEAVGAEPKPDRSLDDELLDRLEADPLDEFDRQLFAPDVEGPGSVDPSTRDREGATR